MLNYVPPFEIMSYDINSATECIVVLFYDIYMYFHIQYLGEKSI